MAQNLLISAIYSPENVVKAASRSAVDRLVLVADRKGESSEVENAIQKVRESFEGIEIDLVRASPYDMKQIATEVASIIDDSSDAHISINLTPGRKTQSFAQMFAAYSRPSKVDELFYYREEGGRIPIPILSVEMTENKIQALREIVEGTTSVQQLHTQLEVSQPMVYTYVKELRSSGYITGGNQNLRSTEAGDLMDALL